MKRRVLVPALGAIAVSIAAVPQRVGAQASPRVPRIGVLRWGTPGDETRPALTAALASLGYHEGRTIHIEWRWATRSDVAKGHAVELAGLGLDLIVASATPAALALRDARVAVPVILGTVADPVGAGLVPSLARVVWWKALASAGWWRQVRLAVVLNVGVLVLGLLVLGRDGAMWTYASLVLSSALVVWWTGLR